jgi:hypothetical protein
MRQEVEKFFATPNAESFKMIEDNSSSLKEVLNHSPQLADKFFEFRHWFKLYREIISTPEILKKLHDSINTFDDTIKYYFTLNYEGRQEYAPKLIEKASTVRELTTTFHYLGNKYRKEIATKMHDIDMTDEEKDFVKSYKF